MDTAVDNFLKEVNELLPPKPKIVWKECFDEASGFAYYWNTETDEVTWEAPAEYKKQSKSGGKLYVPPPTEPRFKLCTLPKVDKVNVKIYKINDAIPETVKVLKLKSNSVEKVEKPNKAAEKLVLISSYGSSSDSENEAEGVPLKEAMATDSNKSDRSDFDDENNSKLEGPKSAGSDLTFEEEGPVQNPKGVSLVPGYADDSDEEFENHVRPTFLPDEGHLFFPVARSVTENDPDHSTEELTADVPDEIDVKVFQRKRRIGVSLINTSKRKVVENAMSELENTMEKEPARKVEYAGFKSGGVLFGSINDNRVDIDQENEQTEAVDEWKDDRLVKEIREIRDTLGEKLKFLCEGHKEALPVQVMVIQMETLYTAMSKDCLKPVYLKKWLNTTLEELTTLEKEAAPTGWLLQWDRVHKRYYYHNQATGDSQWEYPQADGIRTEEAMDISTTPPHVACEENSSDVNPEGEVTVPPPPPPTIREKSLSPPPAPIISKIVNVIERQPLPPGVEDELTQKVNSKNEERNSSFSSELSSFYSDIAAIESSRPQCVVQREAEESKVETTTTQPAKKKKKVKVASGLAMKKKGVSQMVEKWKNLQKNYD